MSDSVQPHRRQPTRLPCPWDSTGKNTGVGCHFLLQCMKVKTESDADQGRNPAAGRGRRPRGRHGADEDPADPRAVFPRRK